VHDALLRRRFGRTRFSLRERIAVGCTAVGITTTVTTVIVCVADEVSPQQAVALALFSVVTLTGGLLGMFIPDPWTAWRRGFRQGCEARMKCELDELGDDCTTPKSRREPGQRSG
jgi:hypothetical protein